MPPAGGWTWDVNRIRAKGYTDNVVDLMVGRLNRLSDQTQGRVEGYWPAWGTPWRSPS